jgi:isopenicillin N synthase-like dioxygenase
MYAPQPVHPPITCEDTNELAAYIRNSLALLASQGWLSIPLPPDLESLYTTLFASSASFFDLPSSAPEKVNFAAPTGKNASDEGFSDIPNEKQLITLRRLSGTPAPLRPAATAAWDATGQLFMQAIHDIAESLELPDLRVFDDMSSDALGLPESTRASSLLRLFRYTRPVTGGKKVVAEAHKDLGLLTLVVGQSPGLDVRDAAGRWVSVEDTPPGGNGRLTATLLAGQTLTYLTRGLYASGSHRVSVLPPSHTTDAYRHSLVFALRPAPHAPISTAAFEQSPLIGPFPPVRLALSADGKTSNFPECSMYAQTGGELFAAIARRCWNVNVAPEEREVQKRRLAAMAGLPVEEDGPIESEGQPVEEDRAGVASGRGEERLG